MWSYCRSLYNHQAGENRHISLAMTAQGYLVAWDSLFYLPIQIFLFQIARLLFFSQSVSSLRHKTCEILNLIGLVILQLLNYFLDLILSHICSANIRNNKDFQGHQGHFLLHLLLMLEIQGPICYCFYFFFFWKLSRGVREATCLTHSICNLNCNQVKQAFDLKKFSLPPHDKDNLNNYENNAVKGISAISVFPNPILNAILRATSGTEDCQSASHRKWNWPHMIQIKIN